VTERSRQFTRFASVLGCFALFVAGCFGGRDEPQQVEGNTTESAESEPLLVTVVGSQETADVLRREWSARSESEIDVRVVTPEQAADEARLNSDLVLFPTAMLGELAEADALLPLDEELSERDAFDQTDLLPLARQYEGNWAGETLALPLGSAIPVMVYRSDVFETLKLDPPRTWEEYAGAATKLREAAEAGTLPDGVDVAVLEPTEPSDAARQFLVRAAAYARVPGRYSGLFEFSSMKPELTSPAFVKALDEYRAALGETEIAAEPIDYAEASRRLLAGEAALGVTFLLAAPGLESEESLERAAPVAVAPVPGSVAFWQPRDETWQSREAAETVPVWGDFGMLIGIGRSVADRSRAVRALESIIDPEIGTPVSASGVGTSPYRKSQLGSIARWTKLPAALPANAQYAAAIERTHSAPDHLLLPRLPGRERYLQALADEVRLALSGDKTSEAALADAAAAWEKITDEIGRDSQVRAYRASLDLTN
jgi:multiple sugar transport system substrate-binding protein